MKKAVRLGDVCKLLDLQPYVLRYWETEFPALGPADGVSSANRIYSAAEVLLLRRIKGLLYEEGYTIAGAKKKIEAEPIGSVSARSDAPLFDDETESAEMPEADAPSARLLDTSSDEQVESLRRGVAEALDEARQILALLESSK